MISGAWRVMPAKAILKASLPTSNDGASTDWCVAQREIHEHQEILAGYRPKKTMSSSHLRVNAIACSGMQMVKRSSNWGSWRSLAEVDLCPVLSAWK